MLGIRLLGQFQVDLDGRPVEIPSRPAQSLLAYLVINAGVTHRREKLAGMLWPEADESNARSYLRQALWRIRQSLEGGSIQWEDYLQISKISVKFDNRSDYWLDVDQLLKPVFDRPLEEIIEEARLYRGELLPGFYDEWIDLERDRLQIAYSQKLDSLLKRLIQARRWEDALEWGEQWILHAYSAEQAYCAIMKAYSELGDPGMVSATYQRCVKALSRDLDLEPSAETTRLYEQLGRRELVDSGSAAASPTERAGQLPQFFEKMKPLFTGYPRVVARERELKKLNGSLDLVLSGQGRVIFVTGEAGSGKTTLVNDFTRRAQHEHPDLIVASGNCNAHTGIGDPYLPFREILELLSGDVESRWLAGAVTEEYARFLWNLIPVTSQALVEAGPDLIDTFVPGSALLERAWAYTAGEAEWYARLRKLIDRLKSSPLVQSHHQSDLFIQYTRVLQILSRGAPLVLVVDDLQWADLGSISLLFHLGRHLAGFRILVVGAYRPEEIALGRAGDRHPLEPVVNELQREFGDIEVNVGRSEGRAFVEAILDSEPNRLGRQFRDLLFLLTRGHPLFTIELLGGMQERGDLMQDDEGRWIEGPTLDWETLPARVEAVIAERVGRLDYLLQAALRAASVEGELFTAEIVARVLAHEEITLLGRMSSEVDRKHHLVRAQSIQRVNGQLLSSFRFRHILVQKYLYNSLDEVERVYLHEQIGNTLEKLYANQVGIETIALQLARHFQEAHNAEKAINYLRIAGERALQVSAYQEAIAHLERALALLASLPDPSQHAQQELSLQLAISMASHLGKAYPTPVMEQASSRALELCQQVGNATQLCRGLSELSMFHYVRADQKQALEFATKTLDCGQQAGDRVLKALGNWTLGFVLFALGNYSQALYHFEQVTTFYEPEKHHRSFLFLTGIDSGLSAMAYHACCLMCLGYPDQALKRSQQALDLAYQIGHSFTLADVIRFGGCEFNKIRRDALSLKRYAEELICLSREKNFASWLAEGTSCLGEALVMLGHPQEGIPILREGMIDSQAMNVGLYKTISMLSLAEAHASLGDPDLAMALLIEAREFTRKSGEGHWEAELYRMRAALQEMNGEDKEAESSLKKALEVARSQEARWWELRAAIDLAHLWQKHGRDADSRQLVKGVYSWFTEGFDTPELREAREQCG